MTTRHISLFISLYAHIITVGLGAINPHGAIVKSSYSPKLPPKSLRGEWVRRLSKGNFGGRLERGSGSPSELSNGLLSVIGFYGPGGI